MISGGSATLAPAAAPARPARDPGARLWLRALLVCALVVLAGCRQTVRTPRPRPGVTAGDVVRAQNERVAALDRLWSRVSVQVLARNEKGKRLRDQGEGHLQIVQPSSIALSLGKVGQTLLYLGSNEQFYWWIDLVDSDEKVALVGRHERVTMDKAALLGVPVYPRDLVHMLGITPLPEASRDATLEWDAHAHAGIRAPTESGERRVWFDVDTMLPVRVELFDRTGRLVLMSDLDRYDYVNVMGDATVKPKIAERADITIAADDTRVKLSLYDPENRAIRPTSFDFERLVRGFGVDTIYDLDAQPDLPDHP
ncbi:MAG: hypothetical protein Kow0022_01390 [Phycisphaerales bacterium]